MYISGMFPSWLTPKNCTYFLVFVVLICGNGFSEGKKCPKLINTEEEEKNKKSTSTETSVENDKSEKKKVE